MISGKTIAKQREGKKQLRKPKRGRTHGKTGKYWETWDNKRKYGNKWETSRAQRSGKDGQWITVGISLHFKNRHGVNGRKGEINGESSRILEIE